MAHLKEKRLFLNNIYERFYDKLLLSAQMYL